MTVESTRQYRLASRPDGKPTKDNFELVEAEVPAPERGEVLVATRYFSVDPYMRGRMRDEHTYADPWAVGDVMRARAVGEVLESNHRRFAPGDIVMGNLYWAEHCVVDGDALTQVDPSLAPISTALGVLGMPGRTAYFGLLDVGRPIPGDTVVVSAAAGAVGSVVGQIAALAGCDVVGITGTDEKVSYLTDDLGFDAGINYREESVADAVGEWAPDGVDIYFENVGGPISDAVMEHLNMRARVPVCGKIALYNEDDPAPGPRFMHQRKRVRVEGFIVSDYRVRFEEANRRLGEWVTNGDITYRETITEGFERAPEAFIGLFEGENIGKQLVKIAD